MGNSLERAATTAFSLEVEQVSGNITKTQSKATLNEPTPQGTGSRVNTPRSDEDSMKLKELMEMCTNSLQRVQDHKTTKSAQAKEIRSLKKRVKKLEQRGRSRTPGLKRLKRLYKVGKSRRDESSIEASLGCRDSQEDMEDQEVDFAEKEVSAADPVTTASEVVTTASVDISTASVPITVSTATPTTPPTTTIKYDMTLAETLMDIKNAKPKAQGSRDKAEIEDEDRLARQRKEEDNIVSWDNAQAMMEADYQMAERLQVEE
ncbi:hypothetical protein Tco_1061200 [Tanacetum coccineum]